MNYQPELDVSNELGPELSSHYLQLIGIAQWAIELGRIDIYHEVSLLSQYQVNPRVGHLEALYHVFAYMKSHLGSRGITTQDAKATGQRVTISAFVDANHIRNKVTRCLHTGIIIYIQNAPILWYSKRQNTVEAATFGSEMVALWICKELIVAIHYKLRTLQVKDVWC